MAQNGTQAANAPLGVAPAVMPSTIFPPTPEPATLAPITPRPAASGPEAGAADARFGGWIAGMLQSPEIDKIAEALAAAQGELENPEKNQTATVESRREGARGYSFMYADLAETLSVCRPVLSRHGIALVQTTRVTAQGALILHSRLIHKSGQWIGTELPVWFGVQNTEPKQYSGALTYARRYSVWSLVGVFGEADTDAPETNRSTGNGNGKRRQAPAPSNEVEGRDADRLARALIDEIGEIGSTEALTQWAHDNTSDVNRLPEAKRSEVRRAYETAKREILSGRRAAAVADFDDFPGDTDAGGFND